MTFRNAAVVAFARMGTILLSFMVPLVCCY